VRILIFFIVGGFGDRIGSDVCGSRSIFKAVQEIHGAIMAGGLMLSVEG
jgi:hypothetical protein